MDFSEIIVAIIIGLVILAINSLGAKKQQNTKNQPRRQPGRSLMSEESTPTENSEKEDEESWGIPRTLTLDEIFRELRKAREEAERQADRLLAAMELTGQRNALPQEMSYGQQQRVALARALLFPSPLLLMDEPFKGLDAALRHRIIGFIRQWQQAHRTTILFASHQPEEIAEIDALPLSLPPA